MSNSQLHFTWVEHQETLVSLVQTLYNSETFFDCTLYAGGQHFDVHRLILSSCSPFFGKILQEHKTDNPVITLDGVSDTELRALVEYIYTGETSISPDFLNSFFQMAKTLEIAGLSHYDDKIVNKMLGDDSTQLIEEEELYDDENKGNIVKSLKRSVKSEKKAKQLSAIGINLVNNEDVEDNPQGSEFSNETVELEEINQDSDQYNKFHGVFMKSEKDDDSSMEGVNRNNNSISNCDTDDSMQEEDDIYENSILRGKFQSYLIKNEDVDTENDEEYDVDVTNIEQSNTAAVDQNENDSVLEESADNSENFVYVKLDNNTLQRVQGNQITKIKQSSKERSVDPLSDVYLKSMNPGKKSFLIKRPKIQSLVGKDSKANPDDKKIYMCLKCGNKYSHRRTLLHHIHWICEQPATYSCSLCPYMGKRKFQLKSHMKHAHMLRMS